MIDKTKIDNTELWVSKLDPHILNAEMWYSRCDTNPINTIEVDLCDVRATDSIRITYDFDRDGWSILQASTFMWQTVDDDCDMDWQEVAFIPAWGREKKPDWYEE